MFHVGFLKHPQHANLAIRIVNEQIEKLISSCFELMLEDKKKSIQTCLSKGNAFIIFGFNIKAKQYKVIACILFSADKHGIWVNWLVVSKLPYDKLTYGSSATN